MEFAVVRNDASAACDRIATELVQTCLAHGHELVPATNGAQFVLNAVDSVSPRPYRRRSHSVFVVSLMEAPGPVADLRAHCYSALVKSLSNLLICVIPGSDGCAGRAYCTTPEAGFYPSGLDPAALYDRMLPIVSSHFALENHISPDLPARLCRGTAATEWLRKYGAELDGMGVLPAPFPLRTLLHDDEMTLLYKLYGITGMSYGNLSVRECVPEIRNTAFWMTGRGVNKAALSEIGRDMLLVTGFDTDKGVARISSPPGADSHARVSVDAIEHYLIYREFPSAGAIVHVHAWMDDVLCTSQNYPCGTRELAEEVVALLRRTDDPSRAVVGLRNHGLTITGHSLEDIFNRIRGRLSTQVPMFT